MQILIISATIFEIEKIIDEFQFTQIDEKFYSKKIKENSIDILISGIGIAFTIYSLTNSLNKKKYDLVLNTGIAGSLTDQLNIGEVVQIETEEFADLGVRSKDSFSTLFDSGFMKPDKFPFKDGKLKNSGYKNILSIELKQVNGITVNTVNGNKKEIEKLKKKFDADIENMEGAAVFYVCLMENVPFVQIRSISNYVEERNKDNWDIPLAINKLNNYCKELLKSIN
ncbi:MAG: futalosine hydrolase [Bacteroidota bacterium]